MEQQTAVEWLELVYYSQQGFLSKKDIEQAKEMEKEQMIEFAKKWEARQDYGYFDTIEMLYDETYNNGL